MSPETQEFGAIYTEIKKEFAGDPVIQVTPVAGDPPNQYEITYNLPSAVRNEQGEISISERHVITMSIPFGFPHFSPSCRPKSPVFHPDFDNAAICLGNYWNRERRLPELIRHIAKMLRGELYSTENAYNQEAVTWFLKHEKDLPFSTAPISDIGSEELLIPEEEPPASEELDVLEDDDFLDNIDYTEDEELVMDDEIPEAQEMVRETNEPKFDAVFLRNLLESKEFHRLNTELRALPSSADFPEREELESLSLSALNNAEELYRIAGDFEDSGNSRQALSTFRDVKKLVSDYPNIDDDIDRTEPR